MKKRKIQEINKLVSHGKLPLAFYDSKVVDLNENPDLDLDNYLVIKYKQRSIPRLSSNKFISKIYELF